MLTLPQMAWQKKHRRRISMMARPNYDKCCWCGAGSRFSSHPAVCMRKGPPPAEDTRDLLPSCFTAGGMVEQWDIIVNACWVGFMLSSEFYLFGFIDWKRGLFLIFIRRRAVQAYKSPLNKVNGRQVNFKSQVWQSQLIPNCSVRVSLSRAREGKLRSKGSYTPGANSPDFNTHL